MQVFRGRGVFLFDVLDPHFDSRIAVNRAFFRTVNRRLLQQSTATGTRAEETAFFCECGSPRCDGRLRVAAAELEPLLGRPAGSIVAPGHEEPGDHVVLRRRHYVVIDATRLVTGPRVAR